MFSIKILFFAFMAIACFGLSGNQQFRVIVKDNRPNIIVILADDMGYSDIGCYGGEINTPNLDYLAGNGLRFTQFYNTSRCCPTRASLLTGLNNHQAGIGNMTNDQGQPGYRGHLLENTITLAEVLKEAGYHTAMAGKWHVSNTLTQPNPDQQLKWLNHQTEYPLFSPIEQYPTSRGFEKFYGTLWGVIDYFDPFSLVYGTDPVKTVPQDYYHTDALNDSAAAFIRQFSKDDKPFFIYLAQNAPHWPVQALPQDIQKYKDTYKEGWDAIRKKRYKKMIEKGLVPASNQLLASRPDDSLQWVNNKDKEYDAATMAVHAAMIDCMDRGIGRIIHTLRKTGELENTLIFFLSDNGASPEVVAGFGPGFDRPGETRDGKKIIYPVSKNVTPGPQTVYSSIGPEWAVVSNTPYRYWKIESYEGGVRTPMIAFWPKGIKTKKGGITEQPGHVMDFMATFIELAQTTYPSTYRGQTITPTDGVSLLPILKGQKRNGHKAYFNEHNNRRYARMGDWKIVSSSTDTTWRLFNMHDDATETTNLANVHPEKVAQLNGLWHTWARRNKVYPKPVK